VTVNRFPIPVLAFAVVNYVRELIAQKLDDNEVHFLYAPKVLWKTYFGSQCLRAKSMIGFG